jgi:hypothetical protein
MRVPFCCAVIACAGSVLLSYLSGPGIPGKFFLSMFYLSMLFLPFTPMLLIPAIQLRSRKLVIRALWLGPLLMLADSISSIFTIDNRYESTLPDVVPGGWNQMNPGGPIENLLPNLAIYIALVILALRRNYRNTRILGLSYVARILIGGLVLLVILHYEIKLAWINWQDARSSNELQKNWAIASVSWLCSAGIYWAFVFGVMPEIRAAPIKSADPQELGNQEASRRLDSKKPVD